MLTYELLSRESVVVAMVKFELLSRKSIVVAMLTYELLRCSQSPALHLYYYMTLVCFRFVESGH